MDYTSAIIYMKRYLPEELVNIIAHYVAKYNLYNLCLRADINFKKLNKFLFHHGGTIIGKCVVSCILNSWINGMKIIFPLKDGMVVDNLLLKEIITIPAYKSVYLKGKVLCISKFQRGNFRITIKYSSMNIDDCYGISGDRVSFNGKEFNFGSQSLEEYIRHRTITVDTLPRSFSSQNYPKLVSEPETAISSMSKDCKSMSVSLDYMLFCVTYRDLYNNRERHILSMIFDICKTGKNIIITNYLRRIFWYIANGYRITNLTQLESFISYPLKSEST